VHIDRAKVRCENLSKGIYSEAECILCRRQLRNDVFAQGGLVLEVVVAKYWADLGEVTLDYSVAFHGVKPESPSVTMQGADGILSLELRSGLRSEEISPAVTLKNSVQVLR
jgi:hypothetical protein